MGKAWKQGDACTVETLGRRAWLNDGFAPEGLWRFLTRDSQAPLPSLQIWIPQERNQRPQVLASSPGWSLEASWAPCGII